MDTTPARAHVHQQLLELKMKHAERDVDRLCEEAAARQSGYTEFLSLVLDAELVQRLDHCAELRLKMARFPFQKTLEQFDFNFQPTIDRRQIEELATLGFVTAGRNVLFLGPPGVGKTHLAVALGMKACLAGHSVYFISGHELARRLVASLADDTLDKQFRAMTRRNVLIIDEFGYLPFERQQATLFFQLVTRRYERFAIIITTNKGFAQWGEVFGGDQAIASAILDRLLHHAAVINIRGASYRLKDHKEALAIADGGRPRAPAKKGGAPARQPPPE
jgi:DNA replication protein DnaC